MPDMPEWVKQHQQEIDQNQFFKLPEGECTIEIDLTKPVQAQQSTFDKTKQRFLYHIIVDKKPYKITVGYMLDALIIKALLKGINPLTIIRAGEGQNTRFSIKGLK